MRIRAGRGLGDSIYLRPIVDHFVASGERVTVATNYPDVFIGSGAAVEPFTRNGRFDRVANYTHTIRDQSVTQFDAMCRSVDVSGVVLGFAWTVRNEALVESVRERSAGRPIVLIHGGRIPMQRNDTAARDLMPTREGFAAVLRGLEGCFLVRIGNDRNPYALDVGLDLNGKTSISDILDLGWICDGVVAQCSYAVPLAEAFGKPLLAVWSARGLTSDDPVLGEYLRHVTPEKVLQWYGGTSWSVIDDRPSLWVGGSFAARMKTAFMRGQQAVAA